MLDQERMPDKPSYQTQVSQFLFGDGFAVAGGDQWRVRRRAVNPALHKAYLNTMIDRVFAPSALHLADKLQVYTLPQLGLESMSCVKTHDHLDLTRLHDRLANFSALDLADKLLVQAFLHCLQRSLKFEKS